MRLNRLVPKDKTARVDLIYALGITAASVVVVLLRMKLQVIRGPFFDTYAYIDNALHMAGKTSYFEVYRSPVLSLITSIFYRLGWESLSTIYWVDAVFYVLAALGIYRLLRFRLRPAFSATAAVIFLSFPDIIENVTAGITDIAALSISIWLIVFFVLATEKDERYYLVAFPLFAVSFLTRFSASVMVFPIVLWILLRGNVLRQMKVLASGALLAGGILAVDMYYYWLKTGVPYIQFTRTFEVATLTTNVGKDIAAPKAPPIWWFQNLPRMLSLGWVKWVLLVVLAAGLLVWAYDFWRRTKREKPQAGNTVLLLFIALTALLFFSDVQFIYACVILMGVLLLAKPLLKLDDQSSFEILMVFWLISYLIFHGHMLAKVSRYFIPMVPGVVFLMAAGLQIVVDRLKPKPVRTLVTVVVVASLCVVAAVSFKASLDRVYNMGEWNPYVKGLEQTRTWFARNVGDRKVDVYADYFVGMPWYLRNYRILPQEPLATKSAYSHTLDKNNVEYFVSIHAAEPLPSFRIRQKTGGFTIYERDKPPADKPRLLLIGSSLDNYLEDITGYKFFLNRKKSDMPDFVNSEVGTFIDDYTPAKLKAYDAVVLYSFRWHDRAKAQKMIRDYVANGGTLLIDASGVANSGDSSFTLYGTSFLDVMIRQHALPSRPSLDISGVRQTYPVNTAKFSPFLTESRDVWRGATYSANEGPYIVLATADGTPLLARQDIGFGKVYWIGHNVMFHAFFYKNKQEYALVKNIFAQATETGDE